jgi:Secretion system C-terminal sorting domain
VTKNQFLTIALSLSLQFFSNNLLAQGSVQNLAVQDSQWAKSVVQSFKFNTPDMTMQKLQNMDSAMHLIHVIGAEEENVLRKWEDFFDFWSIRMPGDSTTRIMGPANAYLSIIANSNACESQNCADNNEFRGNWTNFGPLNPDYGTHPNGIRQKAGAFYTVWVDKNINSNGHQTIYAGGWGGLFRTDNNGVDWRCVTNNICNIAVTTVSAFDVNPFNTDDIYMAVSLPDFDFTLGSLGSGMWHTTDGGVNWKLVTNYPLSMNITKPEAVLVNAIKFCPYKVSNGTKSMVVVSMYEDVQTIVTSTFTNSPNGIDPCNSMGPPNSLNPISIGKVRLIAQLSGSQSFTDLTAPTQGFPLEQDATQGLISDIDFPNDAGYTGNIIVSVPWGHADNTCFNRGVCIYRVKFDLNTITGTTVDIMFNNQFNGLPYALDATTNITITKNATTHHLSDMIAAFTTEYGGNGKCYTVASVRNANPAKNSMFEWNINAAAPCTTVTWHAKGILIPGANTFGAITLLKSGTSNEVFYITQSGQGATGCMLFFSNNAWQIQTIVNNQYGATLLDFHADIRAFAIKKGTTNPSAATPWQDDVVLWANDGGLSETSNHNPLSNMCTMKNLNSKDLKIATIEDFDIDEGRAIIAGGHDNDQYYYKKSTDSWVDNIGLNDIKGDGSVSVFDRRFYSLNGTRVIAGSNQFRSYVDEPYINNFRINIPTPSGESYGSFKPSPNANFYNKYNVLDSRINFAYRRPFYSGPNNYAFLNYFDPSNFGDNNNFKNNAYKSGKTKVFKIAQNDNSIAYTASLIAVNASVLVNGDYSCMMGRGVYKINHWEWKDITEFKKTTYPMPILDIVVDPKNANRIFVSYGAIYYNNAVVERVCEGNWDASLQKMIWTNMRQGLPGLPVNCLVYQEGTDDVIFAGTDAGVYKWIKATKCWIKFNGIPSGNKLPNLRIFRLKIDYCTDELVAGTFGRGLWRTPLRDANAATYYELTGETTIIDQNITWDNTTTIPGTVRVKAGSTLTIKTNIGQPQTVIGFNPHAVIWVEPGAKIIVDNAKLTNMCGNIWGGIYALGDNIAPQSQSNMHATIITRNDAIIENAYIGINEGNEWGAGTGAIMLCDNTTFLNNWKCVQTLAYQNTNASGTPINNASHFTNCNFIIDNNFFSEQYYADYFEAMVTMYSPQGIWFRGCHFTNNHTNPNPNPTPGLWYKRMAIGTGDGQFVLTDNCQFEGFDVAVHSVGFSSGAKNGTVIQGATFNQNEIGLKMDNTMNHYIWDNTFKIGKFWNGVGGNRWGTNSWFSEDFDLSNNIFINGYPSLTEYPLEVFETGGAFMHSTGSRNQSVRNNIYTGLKWGNLSYGINRDATFAAGLNYHCNTFNWCERDIENVDDIKLTQTTGGWWNPGPSNAYNKFSLQGNPPSPYVYSNLWHWYQHAGQNGGNIIDYYYTPAQGGAYIPTNIDPSTLNVNINTLTGGAYCGPLGGPTLGNELVQSIIVPLTTNPTSTYYNLLSQYQTASALYSSLADGGSESNRIDEINNSSNMLMLKTSLLAQSPKLTADVIIDLIISNKLNQAMLIEVLLANPVGTQNSEVYLLLKSGPHAISSYYLTLIQNTWDTPTLLDNLQNQKNAILKDMDSVKQDIIKYYNNIGTYNQDSVNAWIVKEGTINDYFKLLDITIHKKEIAKANVLINTIYSQFPNRDETTEAHYKGYKALANFFSNMVNKAQTPPKLDSALQSELLSIAKMNAQSAAKAWANGIMCIWYRKCNNLNLPNIANKRDVQAVSANSSNLLEVTAIKAYPNPAKNVVSFEWPQTLNTCETQVVIYDIFNKLVEQHSMPIGQLYYNLNTSNYSNGYYIAKLICQNQVLTTKFQIAK